MSTKPTATTPAYLRDLAFIKRAGFPFIKFELEMALNRDHYGYNSEHEIDFGDDADAELFVLGRLPQSVRDAIVFAKLYDDPSCGTELTVTLPTLKADLIIPIMAAMRDLYRATTGDDSGDVSMSNCGMHITVMTGSRYPAPSYSLNQAGADNFAVQVTKLLPALYAAATHNGTTRGYTFREPRVSPGSKYSAIYSHSDSCYEYRLFDPCFDRPDAVFEKLGVIARTLEYYANPAKRVKLKSSDFYLKYESTIAASLDTVENLNALNECLPLIVPKYGSIKDFKTARGINLNKTDVAAAARKRLERYRYEYKAYLLEHKARFLRDFSAWYFNGRHNLGPIAATDPAFMEAEYRREHSPEAPRTLREWVKYEHGNESTMRLRLN